MEKKTLSNILEGKIFKIPDYQRGYAWELKQWRDFVEDIDALIDEDILSHYTGTIVLFQKSQKPTENYGTKKLEVFDVVDGQQRLTTCSLYLGVILNELVKLGEEDYIVEKVNYLCSKTKSKLVLNNEAKDYYFDLINNGSSNIEAKSIHQERLLGAYNYFINHIKEKFKKGNDIQYLKNLYDAIVRKLNFSSYSIEKESEIGMTFELMNSRGKNLSSLELLKNYLMHWVYRNTSNKNDTEELTQMINKSWKEVYTNISECNGNEEQCLRIAWTLYHSYTPKHWMSYNGFKQDDVIPLRNFVIKSKIETQEFLEKFVLGLAKVSKHYSAIISPKKIDEEHYWLTKIHRAGNVANYLPLLVASRMKSKDENYIELLKALELFSYRVFLWSGKRSNTGKSRFYRWSYDVFSNNHNLSEVTQWVLGLINWYNNNNAFLKNLKEEFFNWYGWRRLLKYTLTEYELYLLETESKIKQPEVNLDDVTIEHILPQTPTDEWKSKWFEEDIKKYLHDISNLVFTRNNSNYLNFEFSRKKGQAGTGYSFSNSDIRQEREIAKFEEWTVESCKKRRETLVNWIIDRWGEVKNMEIPQSEIEKDIEDEDDNDII